MHDVPRTEFVIIPAEQLWKLIREAVCDALESQSVRSNPAPSSDAELFTYSDVTKKYKVSESSLRRAVARGDLVPAKIGSRSIRFTKAALQEFLSTTTVETIEVTTK